MKRMSLTNLLAVALLTTALSAQAADSTAPIAAPDLVFDEVDGVVAVEAEHFYMQTLTDKRAWHITSSKSVPGLKPDADPPHVGGASGGAYLEILPDTRATHDDKLIQGENFTDKPGLMAVLRYKVNVNTPGRYYLWVRSFSTGSEDNGVHVGLNGRWPESGQRWQTVQKQKWAWDCKQRTADVHTGVPMQLFLDIEKAGENEILFALREDGFEMDKFVLASSKEFTPEGTGPGVKVKAGQIPAPFPEVAEAVPAPAVVLAPLVLPRQADGKGAVEISGELKEWHKVTLTLDGPYAHELDNEPNPFTDCKLTVTFTHESGAPSYQVPGYFAADGNAGESSAEAGTKWRAHLAPDKAGIWKYSVSFTRGHHAALNGGGVASKPFDGVGGSFKVAKTDKQGRDFRAQGRLQYVGKHHLRFAGSKEYFLKAGPDAPETLLAYADFDGTEPGRKREARAGEASPTQSLHHYAPHIGDWKAGDPVWKGGKGKGLIGALNYLAGKGMNAFSFLPYNAGGDGDNVWPFVARDDKLHWDCSKLDQWGIVFDHATAQGLYLHFKLQENEIDDDRRGDKSEPGRVPESLDGGKLGHERKLYCREIIARFGHALALNWNIGEENTQSTEEINDMIAYLRAHDPYHHHVVIHTFPGQQDKVYTPLLGDQSLLTGTSLQNGWNQTHQLTLKWVTDSAQAGKPWVVANDEQGGADTGVPPDLGYAGYNGKKKDGKAVPTTDDIRQATLWGNLLAGGAGVEYYFGYLLPQNDLICEDFRSRDKSWDYCRIALDFFRENRIPFWEMKNANALIDNEKNDNSKYCLAKPGELYLVYLPKGGTTELDLTGANGSLTVKWFNPRRGGALQDGSGKAVSGGGKAALGNPPADAGEDWLIVIHR